MGQIRYAVFQSSPTTSIRGREHFHHGGDRLIRLRWSYLKQTNITIREVDTGKPPMSWNEYQAKP